MERTNCDVSGKLLTIFWRRFSGMFPDYLSITAAELGEGQPVKVTVLGGQASVACAMAEDIRDEIVRGLSKGSKPTLIVPVGPVDQYPILAQLLNREQIDCREVMFINMDEYLADNGEWISEEHPLSFRGFMNRQFYGRLNPQRAPRPDHRIFPDPQQPGALAEIIERRGRVDACYGGIGINGHLAFNEPPNVDAACSVETFASLPARVVDLAPETRTINSVTVGGGIPAIPRRAVTVGMKEILASRCLRFYCNRPWQSGIVRQALHGPITPLCPASLMRLHADASLAMADYVAERPNIQLR